MAITIPQEEYEALTKFREPNVPQLTMLAKMCGYAIRVREDLPFIKGTSAEEWDPVENLVHNHKLLAALIDKGDCRLFYDHEINEYFIYEHVYTDELPSNPPLSHRTSLAEAVVEAAVNLWCPED